MKKIVLGIDPGTHHLGVGFISKEGNDLKLITADTLHAPAKAPLYERLSIIYEKLEMLFEMHPPDEVAIEDVFVANNPKSVLQLGIARGIVFALCIKRGIQVFEYAPTQVKQAVTGHGRADKQQVKRMVGMLLGSPVEGVGMDATDAVAIAVCHATQTRIKSILSC